MKLQRPIAFVFSGGASLGALQVGMLKAVEEAGIKPDVLVGCSAGALNAAWMGIDYSASQIQILEKFWKSLTTKKVFPDIVMKSFLTFIKGSGDSIASHRGVQELILGNYPDDFSKLKIPTHIIASDLGTGSPTDLKSGNLHLSLLASSAIPGIFPAVKIGNQDFVDGALTAHLPLSLALDLDVKTLFVFDSSYPCSLKKVPSSYLPKLLYMLTIMIQQQSRCSFGLCKEKGVSLIYLPVPCPLSVLPHDFSQAEKLIEDSYQLSRKFLKDIENFEGGFVGHPHIH